MKNTLRMVFTACYDQKCMHNDHNRCKRATPLGDCRRRDKYMMKWSEKHGR